MGIANYSSMLLNNAEFDTETETVVGSNYAWNKILIDGKYYYFDNTWNITRSDNRHRDALMTLSFKKNIRYLVQRQLMQLVIINIKFRFI